MNVIRKGDSPELEANAPIFDGTVHRRPMVTPEMSQQVTVGLVRFSAGGKTRWHTHTADQSLYVTEGHGIVASESHEHAVEAGDIVHVPAGEVHWHGAAPGKDMAHLSILPPCETRVL